MQLFIPWRFFFRCLRKQETANLEYWLTYFSFEDKGVTLIPEVPITPEDVTRETRPPSRDAEERILLSALSERKRVRTLH